MLTDIHHGNTALADKVQIVAHNIKKKKKKKMFGLLTKYNSLRSFCQSTKASEIIQ